MQTYTYLTRDHSLSLCKHVSLTANGYFVRCESPGLYYAHFPSFSEFKSSYTHILNNNDTVTMHECITHAYRRQKMRFDIDIDRKKNPVDEKDVYRFIDKLCNTVSEFLHINIDTILVCNSNSEEKFSFHIITTRHYFLSNAEAAGFCNYIVDKLSSENLSRFIDKEVYKTVQNFRLISSSKNGRVKKLDSMSYCKPLDPIEASMLTYITDTDVVIVSMVFPISVSSPSISLKKTHISPELEHLSNKLLMLMQKNEGTGTPAYELYRCEYSQTIKCYVFSYKRLISSRCVICKSVHERDGIYMFSSSNVNISGLNKVTVKCRRNPSEKLIYYI